VTEPSFDLRKFRHALGRFASGVAVITIEYEGRPHGMTVNSFVSVSLDPPLVLVSLDHRSYLHRILPDAARYGVSVLAEDQQHLSNHFAGRPAGDLPIHFLHRHGMPLLEGAVAFFVVQLIDVHAAGDHSLYIGRVEHFEWHDDKPLLFFGGRYRQLGAEKAPAAVWPQDEFSLFSIGSFDPPVA
jgi:flavin reductase (DIM6/NTAB) family NADH-FMN oxidoreductase RutF